MTTDRISAALERGVTFDLFIETALVERYGDSAPAMLVSTPTFDTKPFVDALTASGCPPERIPRLVAMLNDLKLQHYFLMHEVLRMYTMDAKVDEPRSPATRLRHVMVDQVYIVMARIFFERFMNLIYYLERGEELAARSRKGAFFKMVRQSDRWRWMEGFEPLIERYDASYRTPEVHSGSVLRGQMERGVRSVLWRTAAPQNLVYALFTEVERVLGGHDANLTSVVSCVVSDYMVEGHWQYVPPWDEEEAKWREILFSIAPLEPVPGPGAEDAESAEMEGPPDITQFRKHVEVWVAGSGGLGPADESGGMAEENRAE